MKVREARKNCNRKVILQSKIKRMHENTIVERNRYVTYSYAAEVKK